jgi:hypothetical protein
MSRIRDGVQAGARTLYILGTTSFPAFGQLLLGRVSREESEHPIRNPNSAQRGKTNPN